jgi:hypothetical protein
MDAETTSQFEQDLRDVHIVYDYNVRDASSGASEKWRYEFWFFGPRGVQDPRRADGWPLELSGVLVPVHPVRRALAVQLAGGCVEPGYMGASRPGLTSHTETGTVVSLVYDITRKQITTILAFSKGFFGLNASGAQTLIASPIGHWDNAEEAHGDKRNSADLERWRGLAKIGIQTDRKLLAEQAEIVETFHGKGDLEPIEHDWPTL